MRVVYPDSWADPKGRSILGSMIYVIGQTVPVNSGVMFFNQRPLRRGSSWVEASRVTAGVHMTLFPDPESM